MSLYETLRARSLVLCQSETSSDCSTTSSFGYICISPRCFICLVLLILDQLGHTSHVKVSISTHFNVFIVRFRRSRLQFCDGDLAALTDRFSFIAGSEMRFLGGCGFEELFDFVEIVLKEHNVPGSLAMFTRCANRDGIVLDNVSQSET